MLELSYKVKGNASPQGKPRVYFTCHPSDFEKCFEKLSQDIFQAQDCAIYYTANMAEPISQEDRELQLRRMNLFVIPVSLKLLIDPNRAMDEDFAFAVKEHIPVLPIAIEPGLDAIYSREDRFGDRNYLLPDGGTDNSGLTYEDKLRKYLQAVLIDDKTAERVRAAFDCYVFLSYRKKDRRYADELMRLIHKNPVCRDIAIWYDEYLTPGEGFNDAIAKMLDKSQLYTLLVTPNLINEENYVHTTEYPAAKKAGKAIFPAEMEATDRAELEQKYEGIPACATVENEDIFRTELLNALQGLALRANDNDQTHNYLIGLAYLEGIDVEVDRARALELITSAARSGLVDAMQKLYEMNRDGKSVPLDFQNALLWSKKIVDHYRIEKGDEHPDTLDAIGQMAHAYGNAGNYSMELKTYESLYPIQSKVLGEKHQKTLVTLNNLAVSYYEHGDQDRALESAKRCYSTCLELLGIESLYTLSALSNLASLYYKNGMISKAIEFGEKAYETECRVLGEEHIDTCTSLSNLGLYYSQSGNPQKAVECFERAYLSLEKAFGNDNPRTLIVLSNLAKGYGEIGNTQKQFDTQAAVYSSRKRVLGENHPDTVDSINKLAMSLYEMDKFQEAAALFLKAYELYRDLLGEDHPSTLNVMTNLALTCGKLSKYGTAIQLFNHVYNSQCKALGKDHIDTLGTLENWSLIYDATGDYLKAIELLEEVLASRIRSSGEEDYYARIDLFCIGDLQMKGKYYSAAEITFKKLLNIEEKVYGFNHPTTNNTRKMLEQAKKLSS